MYENGPAAESLFAKYSANLIYEGQTSKTITLTGMAIIKTGMKIIIIMMRIIVMKTISVTGMTMVIMTIHILILIRILTHIPILAVMTENMRMP